MGRSTNLVENPAVKTYQWKNEKFNKKSKSVEREAGWYYYDKSTEENVRLDTPARFLWLESMQSITGFNKKENTGIYSNEVPASKDAIQAYGYHDLNVKIKQEEVASGKWADIKDEVKGLGGKYCIAVYAAMQNTDNEFEIVRFLFAGSSRQPWMTLGKRSDLLKNAVVLTGEIDEVEMPNGDTFQAPILKLEKFTEEEEKAANGLSEDVDEFFKFLFSQNSSKKDTIAIKSNVPDFVNDDDLDADY